MPTHHSESWTPAPRPAEKVVPEVLEMLKSHPTLRYLHIPDARLVDGTPGFPDFIIAGPGGGLIARECKPNRNSHLSHEQMIWRYALEAAGVSFSIWDNADLSNGRISRELNMVGLRAI